MESLLIYILNLIEKIKIKIGIGKWNEGEPGNCTK